LQDFCTQIASDQPASGAAVRHKQNAIALAIIAKRCNISKPAAWPAHGIFKHGLSQSQTMPR
jgi:hypothetical protein